MKNYANQERKAWYKMYRGVVVNNRSQRMKFKLGNGKGGCHGDLRNQEKKKETSLNNIKWEKEIESQNAHRCRYTPDGYVVHTVIQKNIQLLAYTLGDYRRTTPKARGMRGNGTNQ
jgi:hypothetical protein